MLMLFVKQLLQNYGASEWLRKREGGVASTALQGMWDELHKEAHGLYTSDGRKQTGFRNDR